MRCIYCGAEFLMSDILSFILSAYGRNLDFRAVPASALEGLAKAIPILGNSWNLTLATKFFL